MPKTPLRRSLRLLDLQPDPHNANRDTDRGRAALDRSLREYGAGRAVLIDRHGRVIAGNKTVEQAKRLNLPLRVVKTDGHHLIAVQREDLDLATDPRAKALAIADNRVGELDLEWYVDVLKQLCAEGVDLSGFWREGEFAALFVDTKAGLTNENAVITPGPTDIVRGELFVLGRQRLLCGDATSAGDVTRLLHGATPLVMTTVPLYGVAYDPAWRHRVNPQQRTAVGRVQNDDRGRGPRRGSSSPALAYVWHAWPQGGDRRSGSRNRRLHAPQPNHAVCERSRASSSRAPRFRPRSHASARNSLLKFLRPFG